MDSCDEVPSSEESNNQDKEDKRTVADVVLIANVIEASKDGEVVKYTIQTKEVCMTKLPD